MDPWMDAWMEAWMHGCMDGGMGAWMNGCLVWEKHKAHFRENSKDSYDCDSPPAALKAPERFPAMALGEWSQRRQVGVFTGRWEKWA